MRVFDFAILLFCIELQENKIEKVKHILNFYLVHTSQQNSSRILKSARGASRYFTQLLINSSDSIMNLQRLVSNCYLLPETLLQV